MMRAAWLAVGVSVALQTGPLPQFDVASVKQNKEADPATNTFRVTPGRIDYHNAQIFELVKRAYADFTLRVEGGPRWIYSDRYDVVVQYPVATPPATVQLMLRALLIDRFKLAARLEDRETPIYSMVLARSDQRFGPKLEAGVRACAPVVPSDSGLPVAPPPPQCRQGGGLGIIHFDYIEMATLARNLSARPAVGRPVVDHTGLSGGYKIDVAYAAVSATSDGATPPPPVDPDKPSIFTALQEQLGLKLVDAKAPLPVLVIDRIEPPTPD